MPGFNYVGAGNSTVKKDAEKNAAKDFVSFLVRNGNVNAADVPGDAGIDSSAGPAISSLMGSGMNRNNQGSSNQVFKVRAIQFVVRFATNLILSLTEYNRRVSVHKILVQPIDHIRIKMMISDR